MTEPVDSDRLSHLRDHLAHQPVVTIDAVPQQLDLVTRHGLFSARALDEGTALLLRELENLSQQDRVLDLGCGYGAIGLTLAARWPNSRVDLLDTDIRAVEAASENITSNALHNATATLSDGIRGLQHSLATFDLVVSNLPAQAGNDAIDQLLLDSHDALMGGGSLVIVAVNGLRRYLQRRLGDIFGRDQVRKVHQGPRHTVIEAAKLDT
jgi:16S rRNA G1207 methylase RsmC